jgi:hypothetical protein
VLAAIILARIDNAGQPNHFNTGSLMKGGLMVMADEDNVRLEALNPVAEN